MAKDKQKKELARMMADPNDMRNVSEMCQELGISRQTYYNWIADEEFLFEVSNLVDRFTDAELGSVWKALLDKCKSGDLGAISMYFEMKGKYQKSAEVDGNININIKTIE